MQVGGRGQYAGSIVRKNRFRTRWGEREEEGCQKAFQEALPGLTPVQNFRTRIRLRRKGAGRNCNVEQV
jgi:hypothetical protein